MPRISNILNKKTRNNKSKKSKRSPARETSNANNINAYLRQMFTRRMRNKNMQKK